MGLGPPVIELYRQLKLQGALEGITNVMELGSQDFWCPQMNLIQALFVAFGRPAPNAEILCTTNANQKPARLLYEALGVNYSCVDVDGRAGTLVLDMNFDAAPDAATASANLKRRGKPCRCILGVWQRPVPVRDGQVAFFPQWLQLSRSQSCPRLPTRNR